MTPGFPIARRAHASAVARLRRLGDGTCGSTVERRDGPGWYAVRTGALANDLNGVVSEPGAPVATALVEELIEWYAADGVPASWLITGPDPATVATLVAAGATPELTGRWAGGEVAASLDACRAQSGVDVEEVGEDGLDAWLDLADTCEWLHGDTDRAARRRLLVDQLGQPEWTRWLARDGSGPVGFASSYVVGDVVEMCDVAVAPDRRRQGIGTALTATRLRAAQQRGARWAVCAPSPDGWALHRTLGWANVPVERDTCCYLPDR